MEESEKFEWNVVHIRNWYEADMNAEEAAVEKECNRDDFQVNQHFSLMLSEGIVASF